jgi:hypothetical protein
VWCFLFCFIQKNTPQECGGYLVGVGVPLQFDDLVVGNLSLVVQVTVEAVYLANTARVRSEDVADYCAIVVGHGCLDGHDSLSFLFVLLFIL